MNTPRHLRRNTPRRSRASLLPILIGVVIGLLTAVVPAQAAPATTELPLFVSNFNNNSITLYAPGANGDAPPLATIQGPHTALNRPANIVVDPSGRLYVANSGSDSITVYPPGANGDVTPIATISGPNTGLRGPQGLAIDANGVLYVSNFGLLPSGAPASSITAYAPGSNGNVAPIATIAGPNTGMRRPSAVAVDSAGRIYVANFSPPLMQFPGAPPGSILVYPAGANGNVPPIATITDASTGLRGIQAMTTDALGNLYVTQTFTSVMTKYPLGANGNTAPIAIIAGPNTGLRGPIGVAVDQAGRTAVANFNGNTITKYDPGASGDVAPIATIAGPNTRLAGPEGLAFASYCTAVISGSSTARATVASSEITCLAGANVAGAILVQPGATLLVQGATIARSISVSSGASLIVQGSTVAGSIRISPGGSLSVQDSTIGGSIGAEAPRSFSLCGSTVRGGVRVSGATGPVVIGAPACAPTTIISGVLIV